MKRKNNTDEYKDWKTERQWNEEGQKITDYSQSIELWSNHYHDKVYTYYPPTSTEPMTEDEISDRVIEKKAKQKEYRMKYKRKRIRLEKERLQEQCVVAEKNIKYKYVVLDVETTGLSADYDDILQVSIIDDKGRVLYNSYIRPLILRKCKTTLLSEINGITYDMVKDAPKMEHEREKITTILSSADSIVGYNVEFDIDFIRSYGCVIDTPSIDIMLDFAEVYGEYSEYYGDYKWQKLSTCADYYGYDWGDEKAHDSLADCKATLFCYKKMMEDKI